MFLTSRFVIRNSLRQMTLIKYKSTTNTLDTKHCHNRIISHCWQLYLVITFFFSECILSLLSLSRFDSLNGNVNRRMRKWSFCPILKMKERRHEETLFTLLLLQQDYSQCLSIRRWKRKCIDSLLQPKSNVIGGDRQDSFTGNAAIFSLPALRVTFFLK
jgi:hypothetical protein